MDYFGGSTWTRRAFQTALSSVWEPVMNDLDRDRVTYLISDGQSISAQDPCPIIEEYISLGIDVTAFITNGVELCPNVDNLVSYVSCFLLLIFFFLKHNPGIV